jgi:putative FmdB family regulatory protein
MEYKYRCVHCNTEFEIVASFATISLLTVYCPVCMSDNVKRVYAVPNFILKGRDFYKNSIRGEHKDE